MTTQKKLNVGKIALALLMIMQAVLCYFGCIQVTTQWRNSINGIPSWPDLDQIVAPTAEVEYRRLCAPFVTLMTLIRMVLLWWDKAGFHKSSCLLSVAVAIVTSAWPTVLRLSRPIYGGLTSTTMALSTVGWVAVILVWVIVAAQAGLFLWAKKSGVFSEHTDHAAKSKGKSGIWIAAAVLVLLALIAFRDQLTEWLLNVLNLAWFLF